jgi:hypothetical protein
MTHGDFKTQFLHFDSASANFINDVHNTTGSFTNAYNAQFLMNQSFTKVKRVYLKSVELPVGFSNIRTGSTDTLTFILNGTYYTIVLPDKVYTSIGSLLLDINNLIKNTVTGVTITFSQNTSLPFRLMITFSNANTFSIIDTNLSKYILGFRNKKDTLINNVYNASFSNYNLNCDNYVSMYIPTLNGMNASMSGQQSTFKIPLNPVSNQVYFYQKNSSFKQWIDITDKNLCFTNVTVILFDKFGKNLNPNGLDYSFTLSLEQYV